MEKEKQIEEMAKANCAFAEVEQIANWILVIALTKKPNTFTTKATESR